MPEPITLLAAAEKIGATFEALLADVTIQDSGEARVAACLYLTIAELHIAVIAVFRSRAQSHGPVLIRSMHEALADLKNVVANPAHVDQMRFDNADQMLKTIKGFREAPGMQEEEEAQITLANWTEQEQKTYDELKAKGFKPLKAVSKFKQVGMADEYAAVYRFLCSFSHSDLNTLVARHAGCRHLRFMDPLPPTTLKSLLSMSLSLYASAVEILPKYTNISPNATTVAIDSADAIWSTANNC